MTVYVDNMAAEFTGTGRPDRKKYIMCHMIADTEAELHEMASNIGVARKWYQGDHYDICKSKRTLAVSLGAIELTQMELGRKVIEGRRAARKQANFVFLSGSMDYLSAGEEDRRYQVVKTKPT